MQRKSIGHTRRPQGLHSTPRLTMRTRVPNGPVARSSVEPKMATSGIPSAAARCMGPESFATINLHRAMSASNCRKEVSPAAIVGVCFMELAISSARGRSAADPKISTSAFNAPIRRSASPAKRSGNQRLAGPKAAPGARPTRNRGPLNPSASSFFAAQFFSASVRRSRISSTG